MSAPADGRLPQCGPGWAYFLDIDGTLAEIAGTPADVHVDPVLRACIETLLRESGGALALISGRTIRDIDTLFPGMRIPVAGQHGAERRRMDGHVVRQAVNPAVFGRARERLTRAAREHRRLYLEDKGSSLALHYRRAPRLGGYVHRLMHDLAAESGPEVAVLTGKRVVELLPAGPRKGLAVRAFLDEEPFLGRLPVFAGDDVSDESAFEIVNRLDGFSVKVGPGRTAARWRLRDVSTVRLWLGRGCAAERVARPLTPGAP